MTIVVAPIVVTVAYRGDRCGWMSKRGEPVVLCWAGAVTMGGGCRGKAVPCVVVASLFPVLPDASLMPIRCFFAPAFVGSRLWRLNVLTAPLVGLAVLLVTDLGGAPTSAQPPPAAERIGGAATASDAATAASDTAPAVAPVVADAAEQLPRQNKRVEDWNGPPAVSCAAWVIADGQTGEVLFGENEHARRDNASTTKMMTAWVVARLAQADPTIRQQRITFSERADRTIGSTAAVAAGETLSVDDLMYGLMLPSGNDASVALAEHFGRQLTDEPSPTDEQAYQAFIQEMNDQAEALQLANSHFKNTHGLTDQGHGASAADLATLAALLLQDDWLRAVVSSRRHTAQVTTSAGEQRSITWNNTNRLLAIEGYSGVKTGTTNAAGACLVASGVKDGRPLIVVVLGSSGSAARYADSRNLFRWGWQQLTAAAADAAAEPVR